MSKLAYTACALLYFWQRKGKVNAGEKGEGSGKTQRGGSRITAMPTFLLQIKAELEGVESLRPRPSTQWKLDIENDAHEERHGITVSGEDELDLEGSRGTANFVIRFNKGDQQSYIKLERLVQKKHGEGVYREENSGSWITVAVMECRGLTPIRAHPGNDFDIKSSGEKTKIFSDADFSADSDFADYDEENDLSVQVTDLCYRLIKE